MDIIDLYKPVTEMLETLQKWKQLKIDTKTKLRLLQIECRRNLAILNVLKFDDAIPTNDPAYIAVAKYLDTSILEQFFLHGELGTKLFETIEKIDIEPEEDELQTNKSEDSKQTLATICQNLYTKIISSKAVALIPNEGKALKAIRYRTRLKNIKMTYLIIEESLQNRLKQ